jgi:hypothetical protein
MDVTRAAMSCCRSLIPLVVFVCGSACSPAQSVKPVVGPNAVHGQIGVQGTTVCNCPTGKAGALASALCWRYLAADSVDGSFQLTLDANVFHGVARVSQHGSAPDSKVELSADSPTREGPAPATVGDSWNVAFQFLSHPLCENASVALYDGTLFGYTRGPVLLAKSSVDVLVFVDMASETVHGISVRWPAGQRARAEFSRWTFSSGMTVREIRFDSPVITTGPHKED